MHLTGPIARVEGGMVAWDLFGRTTLKWSPDHSSEEWTSEGPEGSPIDPVPSSASRICPKNEVINESQKGERDEEEGEEKEDRETSAVRTPSSAPGASRATRIICIPQSLRPNFPILRV